MGLNFDREEPEMRIFSESESLVSSPRVGKENIPPSSNATSRRIMRARPEEFSSQTNSVNPSPKKQPRLNLLLSPSTAAASPSNWSQTSANVDCNSENCHEHTGDESCCKRYKLEDQLSDIQFIDCGTPEHAVPPTTTQTLYTSVQVHNPPKSSLSKTSLYGSTEIALQQRQQKTNQDTTKSMVSNTTNPKNYCSTINSRYSYPSVQLGSKRKDQDGSSNAANTTNTKERFSYPGSNISADRRFSSKEAMSKMLIEEALENKKDMQTPSQQNINKQRLVFASIVRKGNLQINCFVLF